MRVDLNREKGIFAFFSGTNITINCKSLEDKEFYEPFIANLSEKNPQYRFFLNFLNRKTQQNIDGITILDKLRPYLKQKVKALGKLVSIDRKEAKSGWIIYDLLFEVVGHHKSFKGKIFVRPGQKDVMTMKPGGFYILDGKIEASTFGIGKKDLMLGITEKYEMSISSYEAFEFEDEEESKRYEKSRAELHAHSYFSKNDAFINEDDVKRAIKQNKLNAMAITDHGVTWGFLKFVNSLKKAVKPDEFKLILGTEAYAADLTEYRKKRESEMEAIENEVIKREKSIEKLKEEIEDIQENYKALGEKRAQLMSFSKRKTISEQEREEAKEEINILERAREELKGTEKEFKEEIKENETFLLGVTNKRTYLQNEIEKPNDEDRDHLTILIKSEDIDYDYRGDKIKINPGVVELYKLITESNLKNFSAPVDPEMKKNGKRPIIDYNSIFNPEIRDLFIIGSACAFGRHMKLAVENKWDEFREWIKKLDFVEIQPLHNNSYMVEHKEYPLISSIEDVKELHRNIYKICKEEGVTVCVTSDAHVMDKPQRDFRAWFKNGYITAITKRKNETGDSGDSDFAIDKQPYVLSYSEAESELLNQGFTKEEKDEIMNSTQNIADKCANGLSITVLPDKFFIPEFPEVDVREEVERLAKEFAIKKWSVDGTFEGVEKRIRDRLKAEIEIASEKGYSFLYYAAYWTCRKSEEMNYIVGGRGSCGSTILNYCLQIGENNPMEPHYFCSKCKKIEWVETDLVGLDLPDKTCSCGHIMEGDGLNIETHNFLG